MNAIILAGGKAKRLNGINKGLLLYNNRPFIEIILNTIAPLVKKIIISANTHEYDYLGYTVVSDKINGIGPLGGIITCLEYSDEQKNILLPCDAPFITEQILKSLIHHTAHSNADVIVARFCNTIQPLCAVYSKNILPLAYQQIQQQNFKLTDLIQKSATQYVDFNEEFKKNFLNINTLQDLNIINLNS